MTGIHCLVVDDEPLAVDVVVTYLHNLNIQAVATANNAVEAFQLLRQRPVDLLFLDIQMPQLTGFDLLRSLPHRPQVVITTAYRDFAVEGFEWSVLDYLVKPFSFARFLQTMEKAIRALQTFPTPITHNTPDTPDIPDTPDTPEIPDTPTSSSVTTLFLKTDRNLTRVDIESILYIESLKDYIRVCTTAGDYLCHQSMTDIAARLPTDKFLRVHRSFTVALDKIDQIRHHCALIGSKTIPVSRAHRQELYRRLEK
ncbi:MAG TPA: LytTR family DNA-binding domain-containing protein [Puia sp.]|jgi:DNA-binding LytR/AlgR family response regulator|nr:LytTR family DNA-binding domain-containing protein [Puia sp.]